MIFCLERLDSGRSRPSSRAQRCTDSEETILQAPLAECRHRSLHAYLIDLPGAHARGHPIPLLT
jgi:hypothetical protein